MHIETTNHPILIIFIEKAFVFAFGTNSRPAPDRVEQKTGDKFHLLNTQDRGDAYRSALALFSALVPSQPEPRQVLAKSVGVVGVLFLLAGNSE